MSDPAAGRLAAPAVYAFPDDPAAWLPWSRAERQLPTARWARNLAANPRVSVHLESGEDVVIVDGIGDDITTDAVLGERIVAEWLRKYGRLEPEPATDGVYRIRPVSARAWSSSSLNDGTRYTFPG